MKATNLPKMPGRPFLSFISFLSLSSVQHPKVTERIGTEEEEGIEMERKWCEEDK